MIEDVNECLERGGGGRGQGGEGQEKSGEGRDVGEAASSGRRKLLTMEKKVAGWASGGITIKILFLITT
ncbi:hypothetical protein U1Q18_014927 [Sarracenia purpurea var. burkii]